MTANHDGAPAGGVIVRRALRRVLLDGLLLGWPKAAQGQDGRQHATGLHPEPRPSLLATPSGHAPSEALNYRHCDRKSNLHPDQSKWQFDAEAAMRNDTIKLWGPAESKRERAER